jgi:drug/metabolite transporter (DMT)-like permease
MLFVNLIKTHAQKERTEARMTKKEMPFILGMILLDIAAPIFLMFGLKMTTAANASLLNNFEIVATSVIALFVFKETIGKRMWLAIVLISLSSMILSVSDLSSFSFSLGSVFVLLACVSWGLENNCTRMLSLKDPLQVVVVKGFGAGFGSLLISFAVRESGHDWRYILLTLLLGFVAYGMSIFLYIKAQRELGAARTSAYYAAAPFIGVVLSWLVLGEVLTLSFAIALLIMVIGTYLAISEDHGHIHTHDKMTHEHKHNHQDGHHDHSHEDPMIGEHSHEHEHKEIEHVHQHTPDLHHRHTH